MSSSAAALPFVCHMNLARGFRGGERQTELLIRALSRQGMRQRLLTRAGEPLSRMVQDIDGLEVVEIDRPLISSLKYCRDVDVLQVHEAKSGHYACMANRLFRTPYVITRRVDKPPKTSGLNRSLYARAAATVTVSRAIAEILQQRFVGLKTTVIHDSHSALPSDDAAVQAIRSRFEGKFLIGHAAALVDRHKGQLTLIAAMRRLQQSLPELQLILLGEGEDEAMLKQAAADLDNVHFEGFSDRLGDYFQALDLFVFPSRFEGLGSVILDAMDAGLPVVASDVGGIPDIVHPGENGLLVPPGDDEKLARAIADIYKNRDQAEKLGAAARRFADDFSPDAMAGRYMSLYESILQKQ